MCATHRSVNRDGCLGRPANLFNDSKPGDRCTIDVEARQSVTARGLAERSVSPFAVGATGEASQDRPSRRCSLPRERATASPEGGSDWRPVLGGLQPLGASRAEAQAQASIFPPARFFSRVIELLLSINQLWHGVSV